jgi:hypothetical protein
MDGYVAAKTRLSRRGFLRLMLWAGLISCPSKSAFAAIDAISSVILIPKKASRESIGAMGILLLMQ